MTGSMIVNNLAGLMMLTSLFVISVKSYRLSCGFYACQSLVLVSIFATLSCLFAAEQLLIWSASAFITKVLLVPLIMTYAARNIPQNIPEKALFGPAMMALLAALIVLLCAFVVQPVKLPMATGLKPALAVALGHFLLGLLCMSASAISCGKFWLLPDGKRLPSGAGASCLASTGTGGNRYRYRRHLRRHCDGVTGKKNMAYPRHAGRE